jgi:hypothetical protein
MGLEAFPEIESFQKLPRQVIVKGGSSTYSEKEGAELRGIVINNSGQSIKDLRVQAVILDENKIPVLSTGIDPDPNSLAQGGIGSFVLRLKEYSKRIADYHLYANWKFDDRE